MEQWKQEIELHSKGLRYFQYMGRVDYPNATNEQLVETLADYDIVLTTYNVLSRDIYFAEDPPERNLRHRKRAEERPKSPLVQILWWRVCLDEAQMVESVVSNPSKVARLIPRQNAWAVTGTPIRHDIDDLFGLLIFLNYAPICNYSPIWRRLCTCFKPNFANLVNRIALRHSKDRVRGEFVLPPQSRVVITVPFTAVEEQHYGNLFGQMCESCGLDTSGAPATMDWDPDDPSTIEKMRHWLRLLRQTCLHPEMNTGNRRILGVRNNALRSVSEVLEIMIDQNDTDIRSEERALLLSRIRRGQLLENALHRQEALDLWASSLELASQVVKDSRSQLQSEQEKCQMTAASKAERDDASTDEDLSDNDEDTGKNSRIGMYHIRLRLALEVEHLCIFFMANVYYQIKTDPNLTAPDSSEFQDLEKREVESYEKAKLIRKEMLTDVTKRASRYMTKIKDKSKKKTFVSIPKLKPDFFVRGIQARRLFERFEDYCHSVNLVSSQYNKWRDIMVKLLSQSLVDQEEKEELQGDEYDESTKHQDEMYVYMEALRTICADLSGALTGQKNPLIDHDVKGGIILAGKGEGPFPELFLSVMGVRNELLLNPELGSLRGIIYELRAFFNSLEWQAGEGSSFARSEAEVVSSVLKNASKMATEVGKCQAGIEREIELFRATMNSRLNYYRQLQQISDTVAPYDEESVGKPLNEVLFADMLTREHRIEKIVDSLRAKRRYLHHLRDEPESDSNSRICVICQSSFEIGVYLF